VSNIEDTSHRFALVGKGHQDVLTAMCLCLCRVDRGGLRILVNIRGADDNPLGGQVNSYNSPSQIHVKCKNCRRRSNGDKVIGILHVNRSHITILGELTSLIMVESESILK